MPLRAPRRRAARPGALKDLSPTRIFTQIVILQVAYYFSALILIVFSALAAGEHPSADLIFGWRGLRGDITDGWMLGLCWILNSPIAALYLLVLIARSKLVPDFAVTVHVIHLVVTSLYSHAIPTNVFWWLVQIASAALMTFLGIWSCQWRELRPIDFGKGIGASGRTGTKGREGAGDYEMVSVEE